MPLDFQLVENYLDNQVRLNVPGAVKSINIPMLSIHGSKDPTVSVEAVRQIGSWNSKTKIEIIEAHHKHKVDAPSGTAVKMGESIANAMGKDFNELKVTDSRFEKRVRNKGEIGMSSIRAGEIIGEHKVIFALDNETITIEHKAQNRHCFSEGAVLAAVWLASQKPGLYSMQDFLSY